MKRILGYREQQVLPLIRGHILEAGTAPSYSAIAATLGMDRHHVCDVVRRLERRGLLARIGSGRARRIRLGFAGPSLAHRALYEAGEMDQRQLQLFSTGIERKTCP